MNPPSADERAGRIAKTLLAHQGRLQMDLAEHLGLDSGSVSRALGGKRKWTMTEIESMAEFFDVPVALFFEDPASLLRRVLVTDQEPAELVAA